MLRNSVKILQRSYYASTDKRIFHRGDFSLKQNPLSWHYDSSKMLHVVLDQSAEWPRTEVSSLESFCVDKRGCCLCIPHAQGLLLSLANDWICNFCLCPGTKCPLPWVSTDIYWLYHSALFLIYIRRSPGFRFLNNAVCQKKFELSLIRWKIRFQSFPRIFPRSQLLFLELGFFPLRKAFLERLCTLPCFKKHSS